MSSSVFPENMEPQTTSMQPGFLDPSEYMVYGIGPKITSYYPFCKTGGFQFVLTTLWPKGIRASFASLRCWLPKGMPIIVT